MTAGERPAGHREITVFLADDNVIVREGVRALLSMDVDLRVVGTAADYDGLVARAEQANPQVLVTDLRMPPNFHREGIDAAKQLRKRHPGTGIVVLSQYRDPEYAILATVDRGQGLATMADRLGALGGGVELWSETGHGTRGSGRVALARAPGTSTSAQPAMA